MEHVLSRFGGGPCDAAIFCESALARMRSVRIDFASTLGFLLRALAETPANLVAYACSGSGVQLEQGVIDLDFATIVNCGSGLVSSNGHVGAVHSTLFYGNATEVTGYPLGTVIGSRLTGAHAAVSGNFSGDPLLASVATGDLQLSAGPPRLDVGDVAIADGLVVDHVEAPRLFDGDSDIIIEPDVGAYEATSAALDGPSDGQLGTDIDFGVGAAAGSFALLGGILDGSFEVSGIGLVTIGTPATVQGFLALGVPFGTFYSVGNVATLSLPYVPTAEGITIAFQAIYFDGQGYSLTNRTRVRLHL